MECEYDFPSNCCWIKVMHKILFNSVCGIECGNHNKYTYRKYSITSL